jgi:hypothetical protein
MPKPDDLVSDILQRVAEKAGKLPAKTAQDIEQDVRRDWGGERHYIAKVGESGYAQQTLRDQSICHEHRRGDHADLIARRWDISVRRVRQILKAAQIAAQGAAAANDDGNALP